MNEPIKLKVPEKETKKEEDNELKILIYPNGMLTTPTTDLTEDQIKSELIQNLALKLVNVMYKNMGIGIAANQCGLPHSICVMDIDYPLSKVKKPTIFFNPKIVSFSGRQTINEGCLSIPFNYQAMIERHENVVVKFIDVEGNKQHNTFNGLGAACIQHEIDHLNGILFIDHLSRLKRQMFNKKIEKSVRLYVKGLKKAESLIQQQMKKKRGKK